MMHRFPFWFCHIYAYSKLVGTCKAIFTLYLLIDDFGYDFII